ncbi:unnamed protein product [Pieris brassicae]|uniref:Prothoracicostatic peptide n=2 Tax=Pieris brassicae TaxID=7116 RepID=A0A9P0T994_PIEBR|nr:unnamed protein product [Pieris brassicae]
MGGVRDAMRWLAPPIGSRSQRVYKPFQPERAAVHVALQARTCCLMSQSLLRSTTMRCVAALCLSVLATLAVAAAETHDTLPQTDNDIQLTEEDKRAWTSLQGGWGKRAWQDLNSAWGKRAWQDLNSAWGKRAWQDLNTAWGKRGWQDLNSAWGKRGWQDLNSAWGKRGWQDLNGAWGKRAWTDMSQHPWGKRAWQDLNTAWGKRGWQDMSSAWGKRGWQEMSSAWGKRTPDNWANLHAAWGKRSPEPDYEDYDLISDRGLPLQQLQPLEAEQRGLSEAPEKRAWSSLHGAWGKRPVKQAHYNNGAYYWKREPGWTNLRGMWGKRSMSPSHEDHESVTEDEA